MSGSVLVMASCEHCHEPLVSMEGRECFD